MKKISLLALTCIAILFSNYSLANDSGSEKKNGSDNSSKSPAPTKVGEFSGDFTMITDYMFRGISFSNNLPAVQGSFNYRLLKSGIYFNLWESSSFFRDSRNDQITSIEINTLAGISNKISDHFTYDIGYVYYHFPKAPSQEYGDLFGKLAYTILALTLTGEIDYTNNYIKSGRGATYYNGRIDYAVPPALFFCVEDIVASGSFGHYSLPRSVANSYNDYMLGLSKQFQKKLTLALQWIGTNGRAKLGTLDDNRFVGAATVDF